MVSRDGAGDSQRQRDGDDSTGSSATELFDELQSELVQIARRLRRRYRPGETMRTTAVVNEAFLRLAKSGRAPTSRAHFLGLAAKAMRCAIIEHWRRRQAREGDRPHGPLDDLALECKEALGDPLEVNDALERLAEVDPSLAEIIELRYFGGRTVQEVADVLGVSKRAVERDLQDARAWLSSALSEDSRA